jgi:hypothetical protein
MYRLIRFGQQSLEFYNQIDSAIGSGAAPTAYSSLPEGGAFDLFGSQQKHPGAVERSISRRLQRATAPELTDLYMTLLSLRGTRDQLYRRTASGDIHWQYARLAEVTAVRDYQLAQYQLIQDVDLRFVCPELFWHGDYGGTWYLDAGFALDAGLALDSAREYPLTSSPTTFTITIGTAADAGRAPVRAMRIIVRAGDASMTSVTMARRGGETLTYHGVISANQVLLIDTGTMQVTVNGSDAYDDLAFEPTADMAAWFALAPGANEITVSFTGGGTGRQIEFSYYESWY